MNSTSKSSSSDSPPSVISEGVSIVGDVVSLGPMHLEGSLEGTISCEELSVGATGKIKGAVEAEDLRVEGSLDGKCTVGALNVGASAELDGTVRCKSIVLAQGAKLRGDVKVG
jgi:cytoskeletal protein CcmA (bactofilin family)